MQAALKAVNPAVALKKYFRANPLLVAHIMATRGRIFVVGAGKAAAPMTAAVVEIFGNKIANGLVIVKYNHLDDPTLSAARRANINIVEAGHPVPDESGRDASAQMVSLLKTAAADDVVICLVSGGGSALLTLPAPGLSLDDLQAATQQFLAAGASINQVNTVRKHLSAVKGGQLARIAAPAPVYTFILSDVVGDPLPIIASGPTVPDPATFADAWAVVEQYQLIDLLPAPVIKHLQAGLDGATPDTPKPDDPLFEQVHHALIGSNYLAAKAAVETARSVGFEARLLTTWLEGEAREVGKVLAGLGKGLARSQGGSNLPACLVLGGETTVTLRGSGKGGRNQEMALAAAIALEGWPNILVVCLGTDGNDGPTDAAGAFADGETVARARSLGLDPLDYLRRNDAYNFFTALDDLIITGPTQTNVNDLALVFAW
jgi:glycerate 2-kinase